MQRRKFVVGMGALASGSAAAVGTGAFTSVEADRSVDVEVAGDANAYLQLEQISGEPNSQQYVNTSNGEVEFDFDENSTNGGGDGFNPNAVTEIDNLLRVANQGTQDVEFYADLSDVDLTDGDGGQATVQLRAVDGTGSGASVVDSPAGDNVANGGGASPSPDSISLGVGDSAILDLIVDTTNFSPQAGTTFPLGDEDGTVTFVADQSGI